MIPNNSSSAFARLLESADKQGKWGPFLILIGFILFYVDIQFGHAEGTPNYVILGAALFLLIAGVTLMFRMLSPETKIPLFEDKPKDPHDADYLVHQLGRNFEILRNQTNQGFLLSGIFMTIGLIVIVVSIFAPSMGLRTQGVDKIGILAGVISEFISGTSLLLYKINFARLNETSDRLDEAWRVLVAYKLTTELPNDKKAEATIKLIEALTASSKPASSTKGAGQRRNSTNRKQDTRAAHQTPLP